MKKRTKTPWSIGSPGGGGMPGGGGPFRASTE